jgi:hypothetical protein
MQPPKVPGEGGHADPESVLAHARQRRRLVLGSLFGLAVVALAAMTVVLLKTGDDQPRTHAAAAATPPVPGATSGAPPVPSTSPSASVSVPPSSSPTPSTRPSASSRAATGTNTVSGWPNAGNTGTPKGIKLRSCPTTITKTATYDKCRFSGGVTVRASNVKITRSLVTGQIDAGDNQQHGLKVSDTTIDCGCLADDTHAPAAVSTSNFSLLRVNILHSGHGLSIGSNIVMQDSYIHDLGANTEAHKDGIYVGDGSNVVVRHNNIECNDGSEEGCTAAIGLLTDFGNISNWVIDGNLLNTNGSYCFYASGGPSKDYSSNHITFINNRFGRTFHAKCGQYGPVAYFDSHAPGMVWRNNTWADSSSQVAAEN